MDFIPIFKSQIFSLKTYYHHEKAFNSGQPVADRCVFGSKLHTTGGKEITAGK